MPQYFIHKSQILTNKMSKIREKLPLLLRIIVVLILLQTLRLKFIAHPDYVYIFSKVGIEPYGRILIGVTELIAGVLLLIPKAIWIGAIVIIGVMVGAILMHMTKIGIDVNGDKGILFITALITLKLSVIILWIYQKEVKFF